MPVVDFHAHFFSRPFFETLASMSPLPGDVESRLSDVAERTGIEIPSASVAEHTQRWIAELDAAGVDHMVTFASLPEEVPAVTEALKLAEGRLSGCALINPCAPGAAAKLRGHFEERGLSGVLLFPAMHHFHLAEHPEILGILDEHEAIVFVHCGLLVVKLRDLLGLPRPYDLSYASPLHVVPAANRAPRAKFVIPHFGAGFFRETLMAGTQCENIHVDSSSSNAWMRTQSHSISLRDVFARALDVFGEERILFGTDSGTFPAGWRKDRLTEQQGILGQLGVGPDKVLGGNARRLLG
ncbi:MAG: amidohydrolase family protein [Planctomycetota bacterium]|jgi:predicted TIM-barrel fold metal-dependent hydrolase